MSTRIVLNRDLYKNLEFEGMLRDMLIWKYRSFVRRCKGLGSSSRKYIGLHYMSFEEWILFCNSEKENINFLWKQYMLSGKQLKYAVSIDRADNSKGYFSDNVSFVTHGFNSWKNTVRPVCVTHNNKIDYFMSCEEASRFYCLRPEYIGIVLANKKYAVKGYKAMLSTINEVLDNTCVSCMKEYYKKFITPPVLSMEVLYADYT